MPSACMEQSQNVCQFQDLQSDKMLFRLREGGLVVGQNFSSMLIVRLKCFDKSDMILSTSFLTSFSASFIFSVWMSFAFRGFLTLRIRSK